MFTFDIPMIGLLNEIFSDIDFLESNRFVEVEWNN